MEYTLVSATKPKAKASLQYSLCNHNFIIPILSKLLQPDDIANTVRANKTIWNNEAVQINLHKIQMEYLCKLDAYRLEKLLCAQRPHDFWLWMDTLLSLYNSKNSLTWKSVAALIFRAEMDDGSYIKIKNMPELHYLPLDKNPLKDVWARIIQERWPSQYVSIVIKLGAPWTIDVLINLLSQEEDVWEDYYDVLMTLFPEMLYSEHWRNYHKGSHNTGINSIWKELIFLFQQNISILSCRWICHAFQLHILNKDSIHLVHGYIQTCRIQQHWKQVMISLERDLKISWICPMWCPNNSSNHFFHCSDLTCMNLHFRSTSSLGYDIVCRQIASFKTIKNVNDAILRFASASDHSLRSDCTILTHLCLALELPEWRLVTHKTEIPWHAELYEEYEEETNKKLELISYILQLIDQYESFCMSMPEKDKTQAILILNRIRKALQK